MSWPATTGVSKNCTNTQVKPWRSLVRGSPRGDPNFRDKLSEAGKFQDKLSVPGHRDRVGFWDENKSDVALELCMRLETY